MLTLIVCVAGRSTEACNGAQWQYEPWGGCSAKCGGGTAARTAVCAVGSGPDGADCSSSAPSGSLQRSCNPSACALYTWQAGPWGACSNPCAGLHSPQYPYSGRHTCLGPTMAILSSDAFICKLASLRACPCVLAITPPNNPLPVFWQLGPAVMKINPICMGLLQGVSRPEQ